MSAPRDGLAAIVLAAGQGTRMRSAVPKLLHTCGDLPVVAHPVRLALAAGCNPVVVVVNQQGDAVRKVLLELFPQAPLRFAVQLEQRGSGDAARAGLGELDGFAGRVLILNGDLPLLRAETLAELRAPQAPLTFSSAEVPDAGAYGRVVREGGRVVRIVEAKDATSAERSIHEYNVGVYLSEVGFLRRALALLKADNAQHEYYLTDIVAIAGQEHGAVAVRLPDPVEGKGVNTRAELVEAEAALCRRRIAELSAAGATFRDPQGTFIGVDVEMAEDVEIGFGVQLHGKVQIGRGVRIDGPTFIKDATLAEGAEVLSFSHVEGASIGPGARVGPFARLRPGAELEAQSHVGNFVELKKTRLGKGAKANHLAYLGDAQVGAGANIGAGTITCNYDGYEKHPTHIGAGAFIGSNSTLIAPVTLGDGTYVAAGSTVTKDVPKDALAFGRARQENREGYAQKLRDRLAKRTKEKT